MNSMILDWLMLNLGFPVRNFDQTVWQYESHGALFMCIDPARPDKLCWDDGHSTVCRFAEQPDRYCICFEIVKDGIFHDAVMNALKIVKDIAIIDLPIVIFEEGASEGYIF